MARTDTAPTPFTTLPADQHPDGVLPDGVTYVTTDEMGDLKVLSWGDGTHSETCKACSFVMVFEKHPADWPNHPGDVGTLRVKIECPRCGATQFTAGGDEVDFVTALHAAIHADVMAEVSKRMAALNDGEPVDIEHVSGADRGSGGDQAAPTP